MNGRMLLRLPADPASPVEWTVPDAKGRSPGSVRRGTLEEAAQAGRGARLVALVPGQAVVLTETSIPTQQRARALRAVPYALEEQLAEDVERLHFAVADSRKGDRVQVAVTARAHLDEWLDRLRGAGLEAAVLLPDTLALELPDDTWSVLIDGPACLVRTGPASGFAGDAQNLEALLTAALEGADDAPPAEIRIAGSVPDGPFELLAFPTVRLHWTPLPPDRPLLEHFLSGLRERPALNLLQGAYNPGAGLSRLWQPWRPALVLGLVWLLLEGAVQGYDYQRLAAAERELQDRVAKQLVEAFPEIRRVVSPRTQAERALEDLRAGAGGGSDFLTLLQDSARVLSAHAGISIQALSFRQGRLDVDLEATDLQSLDRVKRELAEGAGLAADLLSASARGNRVQGRLQVRREGT